MRRLTSAIAAVLACTWAQTSAETELEPAVIIANRSIQPQVAVDGSGRIAVVFIQEGNIVVATSGDGGKTFSPPVVAIDVKGRAEGGAQRGPRIGMDGKGNMAVTAPVTFDDAEQKQKYPTSELYIVTSKDGGKSWTGPLQVNSVAKKAPEALHWLALAPDGTAHVAWLDLRDRNGPGQDIFVASVTGRRVSENRSVALGVCECCAPGLAVAGGGESVVLAWREGGEKPSREVLALEITGDGKPKGKAIRLNAEDSRVPN